MTRTSAVTSNHSETVVAIDAEKVEPGRREFEEGPRHPAGIVHYCDADTGQSWRIGVRMWNRQVCAAEITVIGDGAGEILGGVNHRLFPDPSFFFCGG